MTEAQESVLARWRAACLAATGDEHTFIGFGGGKYRWHEPSGLLCIGAVTRHANNGARLWRSGSYSVTETGGINRAPQFLRDVARQPDRGATS